MNVNLPGGLAEVSLDNSSGSPVITLATPIGGGPPSGVMTVQVDSNVTKAALVSTIAALTQVLAGLT